MIDHFITPENAVHLCGKPILLLAFALAACGDDAVVEPIPRELTAEEAETIYKEVEALVVAAEVEVPGVGVTVPCANDGTATASLGVNFVADTVYANVGVALADCGVAASVADVAVLNTQAPINLASKLSVSSGLDIILAGTVKGSFDWTIDEAPGTCEIDLAVAEDVDVTAMTSTNTVTGMMCGHAIEIVTTKPLG